MASIVKILSDSGMKKKKNIHFEVGQSREANTGLWYRLELKYAIYWSLQIDKSVLVERYD